jgi:hypothetical protein
VIIDGSYVTAKDEPEDIDLILVLPADWNPDQQLRPFEYNTVSKRMIRQLYRLDAHPFAEGSEAFVKMLDFFMSVNPKKGEGLTGRVRRGVLRITL